MDFGWGLGYVYGEEQIMASETVAKPRIEVIDEFSRVLAFTRKVEALILEPLKKARALAPWRRGCGNLRTE